MLFFKTNDKTIQNYHLSLSVVPITVTGWVFSTCKLPLPCNKYPNFLQRMLKSCKQVKFFRVLSRLFLQLGCLPLQIAQPCSLTIGTSNVVHNKWLNFEVLPVSTKPLFDWSLIPEMSAIVVKYHIQSQKKLLEFKKKCVKYRGKYCKCFWGIFLSNLCIYIVFNFILKNKCYGDTK